MHNTNCEELSPFEIGFLLACLRAHKHRDGMEKDLQDRIQKKLLIMAKYKAHKMMQSVHLSHGVWQWWFRNKKTLEPLSAHQRIELIKNDNWIEIEVPEHLIDDKDAVLYVERVR